MTAPRVVPATGDDMRVEFSAIRQELTALSMASALEIRTVDQDIRREMHSPLGEVVARRNGESAAAMKKRVATCACCTKTLSRGSRIQEGPLAAAAEALTSAPGAPT